MNTLHITSGEYFNAILQTKYNLSGVPFNEAMMTGNALSTLFDRNFISLRAKTHGVSETLYREKLSLFFNAMENLRSYDEICLWFGKDVFCQMNALTVLAYLETLGFQGRVFAQYIDDETGETIGEKTPVCVNGKYALYESVLVQKTPATCDDPVMKNVIRLYFDYLSDDGFLA